MTRSQAGRANGSTVTPPRNGSGIALNVLESHLWEAANILRGAVDAADFKTYVFPLLFFKRISDVYDEEYAAALTESGSAPVTSATITGPKMLRNRAAADQAVATAPDPA